MGQLLAALLLGAVIVAFAKACIDDNFRQRDAELRALRQKYRNELHERDPQAQSKQDVRAAFEFGKSVIEKDSKSLQNATWIALQFSLRLCSRPR